MFRNFQHWGLHPLIMIYCQGCLIREIFKIKFYQFYSTAWSEYIKQLRPGQSHQVSDDKVSARRHKTADFFQTETWILFIKNALLDIFPPGPACPVSQLWGDKTPPEEDLNVSLPPRCCTENCLDWTVDCKKVKYYFARQTSDLTGNTGRCGNNKSRKYYLSLGPPVLLWFCSINKIILCPPKRDERESWLSLTLHSHYTTYSPLPPVHPPRYLLGEQSQCTGHPPAPPLPPASPTDPDKTHWLHCDHCDHCDHCSSEQEIIYKVGISSIGWPLLTLFWGQV